MKKGLLAVIGIVSLLGLSACNFTTDEFTHFTTPVVKRALTPPTGWDYKYAYNSADEVFDFTKYSNSFHTDIEYSWAADGDYSNYTAAFPVSENASPFSITLTFRHSNTAWQPFHENTYVPVSTTIGSDNTVGSVKKFEFSFVNGSSHNFLINFDFSSTSSGFSPTHSYNFGGGSLTLASPYFGNSFLNSVVVGSFGSVRLSFTTSLNNYFNAFYLDDLGVSTAYTNGYNSGTSDGYSSGYAQGYDSGESVGYSSGYTEGAGDAYSMGVSDGLDLANQAWTLQDGFEDVAGMLINMVLLVASFKVFGVSLMDLLVLLASIVLIVWILKMVRG